MKQDSFRVPPRFSVPFQTLLQKEILRFLSVYNQTVIAPLISASLYLLIFGVVLGRKLPSPYPKVSYIAFLVPGLVTLGLINNAFQNTSSSIFLSKYLGNIVDILVAPLSYTEIVVAYMLGGALRGLLVAGCVALVARLFVPLFPVHPLYLILFSLLTSSIFALFGYMAALWAERFDDLAIFNTYLILPFLYLGGIFYSVQHLPPILRSISYSNPMLYMVNGIRYGFLGRADTSPAASLLFCLILFAFAFAISLQMTKIGYKLKT